MLGILKSFWVTAAVYRNWIVAFVVGGVLITVLAFYGNCRANAVALESTTRQVKELKLDLVAMRDELGRRNDRIRKINEDRVRELREAEQTLHEAMALTQELRLERDAALEQLEEVRFKLLENIRDDETFADWANTTVPVNTWSLLRAASEGTAGSGM